MGTLLLLDIPKVPSDSTIQELLKSVFGMLGMKNLTRLDSDHMCPCSVNFVGSYFLHTLLGCGILISCMKVVEYIQRKYDSVQAIMLGTYDFVTFKFHRHTSGAASCKNQ